MLVEAETEVSVRREAAEWFRSNWNPEMSVGEWWALLVRSGWGFPTFPEEWFGRGLSSKLAAAVNDERKRAHAAPPCSSIGARVLGQLVLDYGTEEQKQRYVFDTLSGQAVWCELFSEPGYGSDLAGLATRAVRDGDEWVLNGQKVWSSGAQIARWGLVLVRTDPDVPKQEGLTCFIVDMDSEGIEARPLRTMNGEAEKFSEVFFTDVRVPHANIIGGEHRGWALTKAALAHERTAFGAGVREGGLTDNSKRPPLEKPAGSIAAIEQSGQQRGAMVTGGGALELIRTLLDRFGGADDPRLRQEAAKLYSLLETTRLTALRARVAAASGREPGPDSSILKLLIGKATIVSRELALRIEGPYGTLAAPDAPLNAIVQKLALTSPSVGIMAGTDEVQRNIIGERVLGLPAEPAPPKSLSWREYTARPAPAA